MNDDHDHRDEANFSSGESTLLGRNARRNAPVATWIVSTDHPDVGATAAHGNSTLPHQPHGWPEAHHLARVGKGYLARTKLFSTKRQVSKNQSSIRELVQRISLMEPSALRNALTVLRRFSIRWRAWASARTNLRHHQDWLRGEGRSPIGTLTTSSDLNRTRGIVSWTYYSASISPFTSMVPMQRWLAGAHKASCHQTRNLQALWRRTQFRRAAFQVRSRVVAARHALGLQAHFVARCCAVDEARAWNDICHNRTESEELAARHSLESRFQAQKLHLEERLQFEHNESATRERILSVSWNCWANSVCAAKSAIVMWRESSARDLLKIRSFMKLEALHKESQFNQYHDAMQRCFDNALSAVIAAASNAMVLGPSNLLDHRPPSLASRCSPRSVPGKLLSSISNFDALNELVDRWYARLMVDEASAVGEIVDRCARVALHNKLVVDRPYESALLDQERRYRSILVKQMIKGSLLTHSSASLFAGAGIRPSSRDAKVRSECDEGFSVANLATPVSSEFKNSHSDNASYGFAASGLSEHQQKVVVRPPEKTSHSKPRPLRLGRDGYRMGFSKELQRAMSGCRDSQTKR